MDKITGMKHIIRGHSLQVKNMFCFNSVKLRDWFLICHFINLQHRWSTDTTTHMEISQWQIKPDSTFTDTSDTRFRLFGSWNSVEGNEGIPITIRPKMVPFSRIFLVSSLVSMPHIPGTPCSVIHWESVFTWRQWLGVSHSSPTTSPAAQILCDSNQLPTNTQEHHLWVALTNKKGAHSWTQYAAISSQYPPPNHFNTTFHLLTHIPRDCFLTGFHIKTQYAYISISKTHFWPIAASLNSVKLY
jgi:hypothetical protein